MKLHGTPNAPPKCIPPLCSRGLEKASKQRFSEGLPGSRLEGSHLPTSPRATGMALGRTRLPGTPGHLPGPWWRPLPPWEPVPTAQKGWWSAGRTLDSSPAQPASRSTLGGLDVMNFVVPSGSDSMIQDQEMIFLCVFCREAQS